MKKKLLTGVFIACAALSAAAFAGFGCNNSNSHNHDYSEDWDYDETYHWHNCMEAAGNCDAPQGNKAEHVDIDKDGHCEVCEYDRMVRPQEAPVEIVYSFTDTEITVENAYYGTDETTSLDTEYRLDDGEWQKRSSANQKITYSGLTPASAHTLYARMGEREGFTASEAFSVTVTLKKSWRAAPPENAVAYEKADKTVDFTLADGIEISFDDKTYQSGNSITHTFADAGDRTVYFRYAETPTHYASSSLSVRFFVGFAGGDGTQQSPYLIGTAEQFRALQKYENSSSYDFRNDSYYALTADISLEGGVWEESVLSRVHIDGRGHKITGLKQKAPLFSAVSEAKNLTVENAEYSAKVYSSDFYQRTINHAILANDLIYAKNVKVSGSIAVTAPDENLSLSGYYGCAVGGICARLVQPEQGEVYGMNYCSADITVSVTDVRENGGNYFDLDMGGLAGIVVPATLNFTREDFASVYACSANLNVTNAYCSNGYIGGLLGGKSYNKSGPTAEIFNCYTTGRVRMELYKDLSVSRANYRSGDFRFGGIAPEIAGSITSCYSTIDFDIDANLNSDAGGLVRVGGICTNAHEKTDTYNQSLKNCLFAGSIIVTNTAAENAGGTYYLNAVCTNYSNFADDGATGLYYESGVTDTVAGGETVSGDGATAVTEAETLTLEWQERALQITDGLYWKTEEGKLPVLK